MLTCSRPLIDGCFFIWSCHLVIRAMKIDAGLIHATPMPLLVFVSYIKNEKILCRLYRFKAHFESKFSKDLDYNWNTVIWYSLCPQ